MGGGNSAPVAGVESNPEMGNRTGSNENNADKDNEKKNAHFMKKIPKGAEASNILVGELNVLDKPLSAFIRLSEAVILGDLTEVPVPTRFIFILLGPAVISIFYIYLCTVLIKYLM